MSGSVFATLCLAAAVTLGAQGIPSPALLVLSKTDQTLSIVDPASLKVLSRIPTGPDPHEVVASSDGRFAYISNYGGGQYNTLTIADLVSSKALPAADLGALTGPHGLAFAGGKVWFTAEPAKAIGRYDPTTKKIDLILGTGQDRTHMIWVSDDLLRIVTSNVNAATMSLIEKGRNDWGETVVPVGKGAEGFDVSPSGKEIWAANAQDGTISILDFASKRVTETVAANVAGANRLKFTPDGRFVLVSSLRGPDVAVFDAATHRELRRVRVGTGAAGIQMQPDGARAYVACSPDNYIAVIDLKSWEVVGRIDAGKNPDGLAWAVRR